MTRYALVLSCSLVVAASACSKEEAAQPSAAPAAEPAKAEPAAAKPSEPAAAPADPAEPVTPPPAAPADPASAPAVGHGAGAAAAFASTSALSLTRIEPSALPAGLGFRGKAETAFEWTDQNGRNIAVFSNQGNNQARTLFANHYVETGGQWKNLREVKEHAPCEEFDLTAEFIPEALQLTDLDADQIAELTFAYAVGCRSDVSPVELKLLVIENGDKYILRGQTKVDIGNNEQVGGEYKVDPSLTKGPKVFLDHAKAVWPRIVREDKRQPPA